MSLKFYPSFKVVRLWKSSWAFAHILFIYIVCCYLYMFLTLSFLPSIVTEQYHIFVGDLSPEIETTQLRDAFSPFGEVS